MMLSNYFIRKSRFKIVLGALKLSSNNERESKSCLSNHKTLKVSDAVFQVWVATRVYCKGMVLHICKIVLKEISEGIVCIFTFFRVNGRYVWNTLTVNEREFERSEI